MEIARRLEENNILTNYQALPDDETFLVSSGIRMGVQEMTRFGMKEKDFDVLAGYIADAVIRSKTGRRTRSGNTGEGFLEMHYCLPAKEALPRRPRSSGASFRTRNSPNYSWRTCARRRDVTNECLGHGGRKMKILVVGSGGREHALAWKIKQSPRCEKLYCAPGNPGTAALGENVPIEDSRHQGLGGIRPKGSDRPDGRRPRNPPHHGDRGRVREEGPAHLRPEEEGGRARRKQDLRQAVHGAAQDPDRPIPDRRQPSTRPRRSSSPASSASPSSSRPTAWPPARASSSATTRRRPRRRSPR